MSHGNPYDDRALSEDYDSFLRRPLISTVRQQEAEAIRRAFDRHLLASDDVLEVGAGTGYYSLDIAGRVRSLIAMEPAIIMAARLSRRLRTRNIRNVSLVPTDFMTYDVGAKVFDAVIAIGVLDVVADWRGFLDKCFALSKRSVIFTAPQRSLLLSAYDFVSGSRTHVRTKTEIAEYLKPYPVDLVEVGLRSIITKGVTLVVATRVA